MPILPMETYIQPDDLLSDDASFDHLGRWWVLQTKARAEKALVRRMMLARMQFFLPIHARPSSIRNQKTTSYLPLFPGYVFLYGPAHQCDELLETGYMVRRLFVENQMEMHTDLQRIHRLMMSGAAIQPESSIPAGTRARIIAGSLAGLEGTVVRTSSKLRLVIEVHFLNQAACVEIPESAVEALEGSRRLVYA